MDKKKRETKSLTWADLGGTGTIDPGGSCGLAKVYSLCVKHISNISLVIY